MSNSTNKVSRKGSGRTKGSFSFVRVPLAELTSKFADGTTPVLVSRKWAEAVGFAGLTATTAAASYESIQGKTPATAVAATVTDLDAS
jgi:hypothetical protein